MALDIYQVDAFTHQAFRGNPAGVCIIREDLDEALMKNIAKEMAVSETAFLNLNTMNLRWFTPQVEVDLCGHGTLSVAHILRQRHVAQTGDELAFDTRSGILKVTLDEQQYHLDLPAAQIDTHQTVSDELIDHLGIYPEQVIQSGLFDGKYFIEVEDEETIRCLEPNFDALTQFPGRSALITARSESSYDFISRYFAPWVGVNEDPVTGSAHCALATYWGERLGKTVMSAYQASQRGGEVTVTLLPEQRVLLTGQAVTILSGKLELSV